MKCKWKNYKLKNMLMFEDFTWNSPTQLLYVSKQNLYKKPSKTWKTFLHKLEIWLETCKIGKKFFLTHLKFEAFNIWKNLFCTHFKLQHWNPQQFEELFPHTFSNFNVETLNNSKNFFHTLSQTSTLKPSTIQRTLFHTLSQTSTLKPSTIRRTLFHTLSQTSMLKPSTIRRTFSTHFLKLQRWNPQQFEELFSTLSQTSTLKPSTIRRTLFHTFSNFNIETLNNSKNSFPHSFSNFNVETLNNLKNSLAHTLNLKLET